MVRNLFHQFLRPTSSVVVRHLMSIVLGAFMIKVGIEHFVRPAWFEPIAPSNNVAWLASATTLLASLGDPCKSQ